MVRLFTMGHAVPSSADVDRTDYQNRHGSNIGTKVLMIIVAILNAGRNSFSFFLLLIVCLGYGVVKPSLGKTMLMVRGLALGHFVFGVIYAVASLSITPESAGQCLPDGSPSAVLTDMQGPSCCSSSSLSLAP